MESTEIERIHKEQGVLTIQQAKLALEQNIKRDFETGEVIK